VRELAAQLVAVLALGLIAALSACAADEDDANPLADFPERAATLSRGPAAGGGGLDALSTAAPSADRCLGAECTPLALPPQSEQPFLSHAGDGWLRLIEADWQLGPRSEGYRCVRKTVDQDVFITEFAPLNPPGTHHTALIVVRDPVAPDGVTVCNSGVIGERRLQGAGTGTSESMTLPEGIAMKVAAGEQLLMNLHLFNPGEEVLRGRSGMHVKTAFHASVTHEAEVVLVGPLRLSVPARQRVVQSGGCTLRDAKTVFSISPHMHQLGLHMKVSVQGPRIGERVLHDGPYDFDHQQIFSIAPVELAVGDRVNVECTFENPQDRTVGWGDSTLDEMCFAGVGLYPADGLSGLPCSN
jgi:Copper type II ascorbate-dependent monooxygenase, C-terminal domain